MYQFKINLAATHSLPFSSCMYPVSFQPSAFLRPRAVPSIKLQSLDGETVKDTTKHTATTQITLEDSE